MKKMKMQTADLADEKYRKLAELFPNAVTESIDENGEVVRAIDKDVLMQEINTKVVDGPEERYQFTWPDKRKAMRLASSPIQAALRPCREESVDFDKTENLYIEGDNLDVLKLLQETYLGKVKMIYIDPPYNTGNDFVYNDNFVEDSDEFLFNDSQYDEQGNRLVQNTDSNGRFHTDWLNMIYPRLKIAKDLLADDGVIFISIDDNEVENLKKICNEIFCEAHFVGCISRATGTTTGQDANKIGSSLDYCLVYSKSNTFVLHGLEMDEKDLRRFNLEDERGKYSMLQLRKTGNADRREDRPNMFYPIKAPDGFDVYPFGPTNYLSRWRVAPTTYQQLLKDDMIVWKKDNKATEIIVDGFLRSAWTPYVKYYLEGRTKQVSNLFEDVEGNKKASLILKNLFGIKGIFDNPKPVEFLSVLSKISAERNSLVLDFFSGSATTAHAVMQLNAEDGGKRKFIMVQLPEVCPEGSEAQKAGYKNICEIGKERIRRAGKKIKDENGLSAANLDIGFRVLKLDSSNMKDVYYDPNATSQDELLDRISNIKDDRSAEDLLFQVMLEFGILPSSKIEEMKLGGKKVFSVADNFLIACFDDNITDNVVTAIAKKKPYYCVLRDSSLATDSVAANFEQIFATYSPDTIRRVL